MTRTSLIIAIVALAVQATAFGQTYVTNTAARGYASLLLKSDGSLWAMGDNGYGQLGGGIFYDAKPKQIVASGVTAIAAGFDHTLFLKSDGSLWAMGKNDSGQLGDGTSYTRTTSTPEKIVASGVTAIAAGWAHSLFLKSDGSLWAMGDNFVGQLGDGTFYSTNQPEQIVAGGVTAVAGGWIHSLFLKSDGSLWGMGNNDYGQLGDGTFTPRVNTPEQIVASGVTAIAAGSYHSLFVKSDGSLWVMGYNNYGQLGDGTFSNTNRPEQIVASGVTAITAGFDHTLFLKSDGSLWAMGRNDYGQLGDGFTGYINPPYGETPTPEQILPLPRPVLAQVLSSKTNLQFGATCGFGGKFYLLAGTNLAQPLNQWTAVWTNAITSRYTNVFSAVLTNALNSGPQHFYILQSQ